MTSRLDFKLGQTFDMVCVRRDPLTGNPVDITDTEILSSVKYPKGREYPLTVTKIRPTEGEYQISATPSQTRVWPVGFLHWDILYVDNGAVTSAPDDRVVLIKTFKGATSYGN